MAQDTKVITGLVRFSYASVLHPTTFDGSTFYTVDLLINKNDTKTVERVKAAIEAAMKDGKEKHGKKFSNPKNPLLDGDVEKPDEKAYKNCYFLRAKSYEQPDVVDKNLEPITSSKVFYSGCYGRASINFYPYNKAGNQGVSVGLINVQKLADGEPFGNVSTAEDDFSGLEDLDVDEDNLPF